MFAASLRKKAEFASFQKFVRHLAFTGALSPHQHCTLFIMLLRCLPERRTQETDYYRHMKQQLSMGP